MGLADYEDDADDSAPPAVPANVPNLADVMTEKSKGLKKPYEVQGASHLDEMDEVPEERRLADAFRLMAISEENKENIPPKGAEDLTVISVRHGKKLVPRNQEAEAVDETTMEPEAGEEDELMAALETLQKISPEVAETLAEMSTPREPSAEELFFPSDEEYYEGLDEEPEREPAEEYLRYYGSQRMTSSEEEDDDEAPTGADAIACTTDTNLCALPLMCVCLLAVSYTHLTLPTKA